MFYIILFLFYIILFYIILLFIICIFIFIIFFFPFYFIFCRELKDDFLAKSGGWALDHADLEYVQKLGSGTSGKVYKGLYKGKDKVYQVAVKVLEDNETSMQEFKKEFEILT